MEVGAYFRNQDGEIAEWIFGAAPPHVVQGRAKFRIPRFPRTFSQWINVVVDTGFHVERVEEPRPSDDTVRACPEVQAAHVVAYFLHLRVRKPAFPNA
jgi:formylglycine-generating enzyme required for sulfatase activity